MTSGGGNENTKADVLPQHIYSLNAVHMLRTTQTQTMQLSQMADQKASILMGATFVVFSISVSQSLAGNLPLSLTVLAIFSFLSSLCAVVAILPSAGKPNSAITPNVLFFGHFAIREEQEWVEDVLTRLESEDAIFRAMLHDIYQNGQVLHRRKFRFLGYAYRMFVVGLVATVTAFIVELLSTLQTA